MPPARNSASPRPNALVSGDLVTIEIARFLRHLEGCFRARQQLPTRSPDAPDLHRVLFSLELSIACIDRDRLHQTAPELPPQIGLLGPTQAGKSSMVNWLLGGQYASVSPLAGFTVHPQGFGWGPESNLAADALVSFFHGLERAEPEALDRERLDRYSITIVDSALASGLATAGCIWDTPDFDSVDSDVYRSQVLRIAALADLAILVVSKDKYADQTVWDMLTLLEALGQPLLAVINKIDSPARELLVASFQEKWRDARADAPVKTITVPFTEHLETSHPPAIDSIQRVVDEVRAVLASPRGLRTNRRRQSRDFIQRFWRDWVTPVRAEQAAVAEWQDEIDAALDEALSRYQHDYLDHPHHYETFQRALARLLTLLEMPGVAGVLAGARRALTWPFRQVSQLRRRQRDADGGDRNQSAEETILLQIGEHALLRLHRLALAKREAEGSAQEWWNDIAEQLRASRAELQAPFAAGLKDYLASFHTEVDNTARDLYERLEERPMVLNSLRATRFTTDAAALALALHTGGIGIQDFVIAPATLAVTSILTESALGHYVDRAADQLKRRQLAAVMSLLGSSLREPLAALPDRLTGSHHFRVARDRLERIEALLKSYA